MIHSLKEWPSHFGAVKSGKKRHEYRNDDREPPFEEGDELLLKEWNPAEIGYTGREIKVRVTHVLRGQAFKVVSGKCIMSICACSTFNFSCKLCTDKCLDVNFVK